MYHQLNGAQSQALSRQGTLDTTAMWEPGAFKSAIDELQQLREDMKRLQSENSQLVAMRTQHQNEIAALGTAKTCLERIDAEVHTLLHLRLLFLIEDVDMTIVCN